MRYLRGLIVMDAESSPVVYGPEEVLDIGRRIEWAGAPQTRASIADRPDLLASTDLIFSGWGGPILDAAFLANAPRLQAFFYAAGGVDHLLTPAVWERPVTVTRAIDANSVPVAEYALSAILFSLKHGWRLIRETRDRRRFVDRDTGVPGCFGSTVGLISLGATGRALLRLLQPFDFRVIAYDPFIDPSEARRLGVAQMVGLDEVFARSDVVSLHTPHLPSTVAMITGGHLGAMRAGATFINTARGEIVREDQLISVAQSRPDLQFVLDVTAPEPPVFDSPLYHLPNVILTPHIAGSAGDERRRMGRYMVEELERYLAGQPLRWVVTPESVGRAMSRPVASVGAAHYTSPVVSGVRKQSPTYAGTAFQ